MTDDKNSVSVLDEPGEIRSGEELDAKIITDYLKSKLPQLQGEAQIKQFPSGASNLTYSVKFDNADYILRRPPAGHKDKSAHDMGREYNVMSSLKEQFPYVPAMIDFCQDESVISSDFYVMERLKGIIVRKNFPKGLNLSEADTRNLCLKYIDRLVDLHKVDVEKAGLQDLGKPNGYVQRQIDGWARRMDAAATDDMADFSRTVSWLNDNNPGEVGACLIHNDYRLDNVVLDPDNPFNIIGVLDWEMCTLGDPLMDLGNSLAYWVEASDSDLFKMLRMQPSHLPGMLTRQEIVDYYGEKSGYTTDNFNFYLVYGYFRLAIVMQQLYFRFKKGQTKDERFGALNVVIDEFQKQCESLIDS